MKNLLNINLPNEFVAVDSEKSLERFSECTDYSKLR